MSQLCIKLDENITDEKLYALSRHVLSQGMRIMFNGYCELQDAIAAGKAVDVNGALKRIRDAGDNFKRDLKAYDEQFGHKEQGESCFDLAAARDEIHARILRWQDADGN